MSSLTVTIPDSESEFVESQAADRGFESSEEYLRSLIASAEREAARARLEALLLEGLEGPREMVTDEYWEELKREVRERVEGLMLQGIDSGDPIPATEEYWLEKMTRYNERHPADVIL